MTKEEFIKRATATHGDKYDYSKVALEKIKDKVCIICHEIDPMTGEEHGEFWQIADDHIRNHGCPRCRKSRKLTTERFIWKSRQIHGDKYDYSKVHYVNSTEKVCIICPEHGEFWQSPNKHLQGNGCKVCGTQLTNKKNTKTQEEFIEEAKKIHGSKYDYSKVKYVNSNDKVCIICHEKDELTGEEHGEFWQMPSSHLAGSGCPKCGMKSSHEKCRSNTEEFIRKAKEKHSNKYDYSQVEYINNTTLVTIICPEHGEFRQTPARHLRGNGCPKCAIIAFHKASQSNTEEFIRKAKDKHGDKYDYSKVEYINSTTPVTIICHKHGEFQQKPVNHLKGAGCQKCYDERRGQAIKKTQEEFVAEASMVHNNKYDYSKTHYVDSKTKLCIICPVHGEFWQLPNKHLEGCGCKECANQVVSEKRKISKDEFIRRSMQVHGDRFDYSKVNYIDARTKVCIICPEHGEYWQTPASHLRLQGCQKCRYEKASKTKTKSTEQFIEGAKKAHGDKYDYSNVKYNGSKEKVCIICPEHGEYWQIAGDHLSGYGCPKCAMSHLEREIDLFLNENNIQHDSQKTFKWLKLQKSQRLDYYLPQYNVCIECNGRQHFEPVDIFGGDDSYDETIKRDKQKKKLCDEHGVKIFYYSNCEYNEFLGEKVYHDKVEMLNEIRKFGKVNII